MSEPIDYEQLIASLLEEQADIARMIAFARRKQSEQQGMESQAGGIVRSQPEVKATRYQMMSFHLAPDSFFRMSVPDAIKKFLNIAKRPKTAKEITAGLDSGGLTHQAKNLYATVYPTLLRMESANEVVRVGKGEWGLSEWYPNAKKATPEEKTGSEG